MNRKRITGLLILLGLAINAFLMIPWALAGSGTYYPLDAPGQVVEARPGGWFDDSTSAVSIAALDSDRFTGYVFRDIPINRNDTIINATLKLWYGSGYDWEANGTVNLLVQGLRGAPLSLDYGGVTGHGATTAASTIIDIAGWNESAVYDIDVTDIVNEITEQYVWGIEDDFDNIAFRIWAVAPVGPWLPGQAPNYYDFQVATATGPFKAHKPALEIAWEAPTDSGQEYKGFTIVGTPGQTMQFNWYDSTAGYNRMTTIDGNDYLTRNMSYVNQYSPDNLASAGDWIFTHRYETDSPWNTSLWVTDDRGETWTKKGEIAAASGSVIAARLAAIIYDEAGYLHIGYGSGFDTRYVNYSLANETFSDSVMIWDGGYNVNEIRGMWDPVHDTIWFTTYGGKPSGSLRNPVVMRKEMGGSWENYRNEYDTAWGGARTNDIAWSTNDNKIYWICLDYQALISNRRMYAWELLNYSDINSWVGIGNQSLPQWGGGSSAVNGVTSFDVGVNDAGKFVIAVEREHTASKEYIFSYTWNAGGKTWGSAMFNVTVHKPAWQPNFKSPKLFYDADDNLNMGFIYHTQSGYSLVFNEWDYFQAPKFPPPGKVAKATGHVMNFLGGDMNPFTSAVMIWDITPPPGGDNDTSCIEAYLAQIEDPDIEDVKDAIDQCLAPGDPGADPEDPGEGPWDPDIDPWYLNRTSFKLYLLIGGLAALIGPWVMIAQTRDFGFIVWVLFSNLIGVVLLYMVGTV